MPIMSSSALPLLSVSDHVNVYEDNYTHSLPQLSRVLGISQSTGLKRKMTPAALSLLAATALNWQGCPDLATTAPQPPR